MKDQLLKKIRLYKFEIRVIDIIFLFSVTFVSLLIRVSLYPWQSSDYLVHLEKWFLAYKNNIFETLKSPVGDYTAMYNYILAFLSLIGDNSLYLIKSISVIFDFIGAIFFSKIIRKICNENVSYLAYAIFLCLPTVILNSSAWAQCDVIYVTFILISFYQLLNEKESAALFFYSISLSLKLQAIFFLPFYLFLGVKKKIKFRCFLWIPIVYILSIIPMLCLGRPLISCVKTYLVQMSEYNNLVYAAPTIYTFWDIDGLTLLVRTGVLYCVLIVGSLCYYCYEKVNVNASKELLKFSTLLVLIIPFLLPKMHDRYFILADIFTALCTIVDRKYFISFIITCGCSTIVYIQFLFGSAYVDLRILTVLMLIGIVYFVKISYSK